MKIFFTRCHIELRVDKNHYSCGVIVYFNEIWKQEPEEDASLEGMWKKFIAYLKNVFGECHIIGRFFQFHSGPDFM